jgi:hypothetical protein
MTGEVPTPEGVADSVEHPEAQDLDSREVEVDGETSRSYTLESLMPELTKEEIEEYRGKAFKQELKSAPNTGSRYTKNVFLFNDRLEAVGRDADGIFKLSEFVNFRNLDQLKKEGGTKVDIFRSGWAEERKPVRGIVIHDTGEVLGFATGDEESLMRYSEAVDLVQDRLSAAEKSGSTRFVQELKADLRDFQKLADEARANILKSIKG